MASIKIFGLRPTGSELFQDSESFLNELTHVECGIIHGGEISLVISPLIESILLDKIGIDTKYTYTVAITRVTNAVVTSA